MPGQSTQNTFRLRINLDGVTPVIWRRILVPGSVRMSKLAVMLIAVMGWTNSHLHAFQVGQHRYGMHYDEYPDDEIDEKGVTVLNALRGARRFTFEYDFGDSWEHEVIVEEMTSSSFGLRYAVCLDGANACPPEDVGGVDGYRLFLEAMANPNHEEHEHYLEWIGGSFEPAEFDLVSTNASLQKVR